MELLLSCLLFALVSTVTPGPNNIMLMSSGLNYGIRRSLPHFLGVCIGFPLMVVAVGLGLGGLFNQFPEIHGIIKLLGVSYLLYMAYRLAISQTKFRSDNTDRPLHFWEAVLFQWVNPKAWAMTVSALAAFTSVDGDALYQAVSIALTFFSVSFPCVGLWLLSGASLKRWLTKPRYQQTFNCVMAILLIASVVPMLQESMLTS